MKYIYSFLKWIACSFAVMICIGLAYLAALLLEEITLFIMGNLWLLIIVCAIGGLFLMQKYIDKK